MTAWVAHARCAEDPDAPVLATTRRELELARRYCLGCDPMEVCLAQALVEELGQPPALRVGVRGGHTPSERARVEHALGWPGVRRDLTRTLELWATGRLAPAPWPPPPVEVAHRRCHSCGRSFVQAVGRWKQRRWCSPACKHRASRQRHLETRRARERARYRARRTPEYLAARAGAARARRARRRAAVAGDTA